LVRRIGENPLPPKKGAKRSILISRLLTIDKSRVAGTIRTSWPKLKVQNPGAVCEVMNRVDRRENIFQCDSERRPLLETLGQAFE
jgi:hypothetical protein